ncbi:hypothetical protein A259_37284 [Pseudomonas syringae pv. actinidiae ICMP 19070]|nr:hypothetical protein A259_37284 [Pseudomonas syringae pv. actinidiae ICMP 19070]
MTASQIRYRPDTEGGGSPCNGTKEDKPCFAEHVQANIKLCHATQAIAAFQHYRSPQTADFSFEEFAIRFKGHSCDPMQ